MAVGRHNKVYQDGTHTSEGVISHRPHELGFLMPVKLDFKAGKAINNTFRPLRYGGRLVFALPGGGDHVV